LSPGKAAMANQKELKRNKKSLPSKPSERMVRDYTTTITILEHLSDAVFILNPRGKIEYANKSALEMLHLDMAVVVGQFLDDYLEVELPFQSMNADPPKDVLIQSIYQGVFNEIETTLGQGIYHTPVMISFGMVPNQQGEIEYIIASAKDISIRKILQNEVKQKQFLSISKDRCKQLGDIAVSFVHNLSQPVTSLQLMVELTQKLLHKNPPDAQKIEQNLSHIAGLLDLVAMSISNVRNFAYLTEDDSLKLQDITEIIDNALKQLSYELTDRDIQTEVDFSATLASVLASSIRLQQVFVTLIKYMMLFSGNSTIADGEDKKVFISVADHEHKWVKIIIKNQRSKDDNSGDEERVSVPIDETLETLDHGLDIAITKMVIRSLGGDFKMEKYGTTGIAFLIRLPIDQKEEREQLFNMIELFHDGIHGE